MSLGNLFDIGRDWQGRNPSDERYWRAQRYRPDPASGGSSPVDIDENMRLVAPPRRKLATKKQIILTGVDASN